LLLVVMSIQMGYCALMQARCVMLTLPQDYPLIQLGQMAFHYLVVLCVYLQTPHLRIQTAFHLHLMAQ
jgi:hypothetical protein